MTPAVSFLLTSASGRTNRRWAMWRCNQLTSIRKWAGHCLCVGGLRCFSRRVHIVDDYAVVFHARYVCWETQVCAGRKRWVSPWLGSWCGWAGWLVALRSTSGELPGKGARVGIFAALMALTQAVLCLQNADVTWGTTANSQTDRPAYTEQRRGQRWC